MSTSIKAFLFVVCSTTVLMKAPAQDGHSARRLPKSGTITQTLAKGQEDTWVIGLEKNGYVGVGVEQKDVNLVVTTSNGSHTPLEAFNLTDAASGSEYVTIEADKKDDYFITIKAVDGISGGHYTIKVDELLTPEQYRRKLQHRKQYAAAAAKYFSQDALLQEIQTLSSDSFLGRRPGTPGEAITIDYLQKQLKQMKLEPGNGNSYLQDVPLPLKIRTTWASPMTVVTDKGSLTLNEREDFILFPHYPDSVASVREAPLVFAGYGIVSAGLHHDDYKDVDVNGKLVVLLGPTTKYPDSLISYARRNAEAAKRGAVGCLYIFDSLSMGYSFKVEYNKSQEGNMVPESSGAKKDKVKDVSLDGDIHMAALKRILLLSGYEASLLEQAETPGFKAVPLKVSISIDARSGIIPRQVSHNVIAKITGTTYPDEYVVYSGHWDHLGIEQPDEQGDSIYNGAWDNATGTAGVLELARAFSTGKEKPKRTILFMFFTHEEFGKLGSAYYNAHPLYPLAKTAADINIDGLNVFGPSNDFSLAGPKLSTLEDLLKAETDKAGRYLYYDSSIAFAGKDFFYFSDQVSFAQAGVPAIFASGGTRPVGMKNTQVSSLMQTLMSRYHRPNDQYDPSFWKLDGTVQDLYVLYCLGKQLAWGHAWPVWRANARYARPITP